MIRRSGLAATALMPLVVVACARPSSGPLLQSRVQTSMRPDQPCNRVASIQYLPDGARIAISSDSLFLPGKADLTQCGGFAVASAIQAMLTPMIMHVAIEPYGDVGAPYARLARERAVRLQTMFWNVGAPTEVQPAAAPAQDAWGIVLTAGG